MPWEDYVIESFNIVVDAAVESVETVVGITQEVVQYAEQIDVLEKGD